MDNDTRTENSGSLFGIVIVVFILVIAAIWTFFLKDDNENDLGQPFPEVTENLGETASN